jgi:hypothetical protein
MDEMREETKKELKEMKEETNKRLEETNKKIDDLTALFKEFLKKK